MNESRLERIELSLFLESLFLRFRNHSLAVDQGLGEMHLIVCRNVLIYFNRDLFRALPSRETAVSIPYPEGVRGLAPRQRLENRSDSKVGGGRA